MNIKAKSIYDLNELSKICECIPLTLKINIKNEEGKIITCINSNLKSLHTRLGSI